MSFFSFQLFTDLWSPGYFHGFQPFRLDTDKHTTVAWDLSHDVCRMTMISFLNISASSRIDAAAKHKNLCKRTPMVQQPLIQWTFLFIEFASFQSRVWSHLMRTLARHPAVCSGLHPLRKPMSGSRRVKIKVQSASIHESLMEDGLHVTFEALDGHAVQVAGQPLLMVAVRVNWVQVSVAVAWRNRTCVCWETMGQLHTCLQAGHLSRGPWKTSQTSQGNCITAL